MLKLQVAFFIWGAMCQSNFCFKTLVDLPFNESGWERAEREERKDSKCRLGYYSLIDRDRLLQQLSHSPDTVQRLSLLIHLNTHII